MHMVGAQTPNEAHGRTMASLLPVPGGSAPRARVPRRVVGKLSVKGQVISQAAAAPKQPERKQTGVTDTNKNWSSPSIVHLPPREAVSGYRGPLPTSPPHHVPAEEGQVKPGPARPTCLPRSQAQAREGRSGISRRGVRVRPRRAPGGGGWPPPRPLLAGQGSPPASTQPHLEASGDPRPPHGPGR